MARFARVENGAISYYVERETIEPDYVPVEIVGEGTAERATIVGSVVRITRSNPAPTSDDVNKERDRRLRQFVFGGVVYDFVDDKGSAENISGAATLALAAIISGASSGNYRWADANQDFVWIAADNSAVRMDATTCLDFGKHAADWKARHIYAARTLKNLGTIPADYAADARWP